MISSTALEVQLKLDDKLTAGFTKSFNSIKQQVDKTSQSFISLGREISQAGKNMTFLGAAITGPMAIAFKTASNYSIEVGDSLKNLTSSAIDFQNTIGTAMVPVVDKVTEGLQNLSEWLKNLDPQMRTAIIQGVLLTGIFLTLGGAIINVVGKMASLIGRIIEFAMANAPLLIMVGVLIAIIYYWEQIRAIVMPVITFFQVSIDFLAIAFLKLLDINVWVWEQWANMALKLKPLIDALERFHLISGETAAGWRTALDSMAASATSTRDEIHRSIAGLEQDMANAMGGQGWAQTVDTSIETIKTKFAELLGFLNTDFVPSANMAFQQFAQNFESVYKKAYDNAMNLGQQSAQIFTQAITQFSNGFGNAVANMVMHGKNFGESMKAVFDNLATNFISAIVSMITQWILFSIIQMAFWPLISAVAGGVAASMSAIWATPAALASLATFGGNSAPAMAGIGATVAFSKGVSALAEGGTLLSGGSVLVGERGPEFLDLPAGARVTPLDQSSGVNVHISGNVYAQTPDQIDDLAERIARLVDEKKRSRAR